MVTVDTNVVIYALANGNKADRAEAALAESTFVSVQVLNEYARAAQRKFRRDWPSIVDDLEIICRAVAQVQPIAEADHHMAVRIAQRHKLGFFDSLMIAVALSGGAGVLYSEDMRHGLVVNGALTIINPFLPDPR